MIITDMIRSGKLCGTLVRSRYNGGCYWSPDLWNSPADGLESQPQRWTWVGDCGWYYSEAIREYSLAIRAMVDADAPGKWPAHPGESCRL